MPSRPLRPALLAAVSLLALSCAAGRPGRPEGSCRAVPLLADLVELGMSEAPHAGRVLVRVRTDAHSADCGTPDCYYTDLRLELDLEEDGGACRVQGASLATEDGGCIPEGMEPPPWRGALVVDGRPDLADPRLEKVTLRSADGQRALVLVNGSAFYFDAVEPGGELRLSLPTGAADEPQGCCWGATIAVSHFYERSTP